MANLRMDFFSDMDYFRYGNVPDTMHIMYK